MRGLLERLYTDRMTVWRYRGDTEGECVDTAAVLTDIPCRLSFMSRYTANSVAKREGGKHEASARPLLICAPEWGLRAGDYIVVRRRGGAEYKGNIGKPRLYSGSQQMLLAAQELC